jgi:hypothetical protein
MFLPMDALARHNEAVALLRKLLVNNDPIDWNSYMSIYCALYNAWSLQQGLFIIQCLHQRAIEYLTEGAAVMLCSGSHDDVWKEVSVRCDIVNKAFMRWLSKVFIDPNKIIKDAKLLPLYRAFEECNKRFHKANLELAQVSMDVPLCADVSDRIVALCCP